MNDRLASLLSWLCLPVYALQGTRIRNTSMRLSPAPGPRSGQFGDGTPGERILTIGDSSAAAVGLESTAGSMASQIARKLFERDGTTASWRICGHNSAVASEIRDHAVPFVPHDEYTRIILMIGTNDLKNFHTGKRFCKAFGTLLYALRARFPEATIYWHQAIDMKDVPRIPEPLATMMNWRRQIINRRGAILCVERGAVVVPPLPNVHAEGFCRDGFHAGESGLDEWADHMIAHFDYTPRTSPAALPFVRG